MHVCLVSPIISPITSLPTPLACFQFGFCCAYVIFVSDNLHSIFPALSVTLWTGALLCNLA